MREVVQHARSARQNTISEIDQLVKYGLYNLRFTLYYLKKLLALAIFCYTLQI